MTPEFEGTERYVVRRQVGEGAQCIYVAWDRERQTLVDLKLLSWVSPRGLYRFKAEFRALRGIQHRNLAQLHALVVEQDTWFMVLEHLDSLRFSAGVEAERVSLRDAAVQLLRGVAALHLNGKVHQNLVDATARITVEGRVVITDFAGVYDLDRAPSELSRVEMLIGSASHLAPERVRGGPPTQASDLYSVGVLLSRCLGGQQGALARLVVDLQDPRPARRPRASEALERLGVADDPVRSSVWAGRVDEDQCLEEAWTTVCRGRSVTVRITGPPGIGKSALVDRFVEDLKTHEAVWLIHGLCHEHERLPFRALDAAMDGLARALERMPEADVDLEAKAALASLFPVLGSREGMSDSTGAEEREQAIEAGPVLLRALARERPVVFVVDETQWGDRESARIALRWMAGLARSRILWLWAGRGAGPFDGTLVEDPRWVRLETRDLVLGPLGDEAVHHLASRHLPRPGGPADRARFDEVARWVARESRGQPWLATELAQSYAESPFDVERVGFEDLISARLDELSTDHRRVLLAVAIAARPLPVALLRRVTEVVDVHGAVDVLGAARWVRTSALGRARVVELAHTRVASSILERELPALRARMHRALAAELERYGWAEPEALLHHHLAGGAQERVGPLAIRAAESATERLEHEAAVSAYKLALEFVPDDQRLEVGRSLAAAQVQAGRGADAAKTYSELAERSEGVARLRFIRLAAEQALYAGRVSEATADLAPVLEALGLPPLDAPVGLRGASTRAWSRLSVAVHRGTPEHFNERTDTAWALAMAFQLLDPALASIYQSLASAEAARSGDTRRKLRSRCLELGLLAGRRPGTALRGSIVELRRDVGKLGDPFLIGLCGLAEGLVAYLDGSYRAAHRLFAAAERALEPTPAPYELAVIQVFRVRSLVYVGDLGAAADLRSTALARARGHKNRLLVACLGGDVMALLDLAADRPDLVERHVRETLELWDETRMPQQLYFSLRAEVLRLLYSGDASGAAVAMQRLDTVSERRGLRLNRVTRLHLVHLSARVAIANGQLGRADRRAILLDREAHRLGPVFATLVRAAVLASRGKVPDAVAHLERARAALDRADLALHRSVARWARGRLVGDAHEISQAEGWLTHAGVKDPGAICRALWAPLD